MATFAFDAHLKLVLASFVPWLIMCCCYGPILSLLIRRFLDSQSFSNLYFNSHIKHNTAVLLFLVLSLSIISEALPEGLTFHSLALSQQVVTKDYVELLLLKYFSIPEFCVRRLVTSQKSREHLSLMVLQANISRHIQHNYTLMQTTGVSSPWGVLQTMQFSILNCCDKLLPGKLSIKAQFYPSPVQNQLFYEPIRKYLFVDTFLWTRTFLFLYCWLGFLFHHDPLCPSLDKQQHRPGTVI